MFVKTFIVAAFSEMTHLLIITITFQVFCEFRNASKHPKTLAVLLQTGPLELPLELENAGVSDTWASHRATAWEESLAGVTLPDFTTNTMRARAEMWWCLRFTAADWYGERERERENPHTSDTCVLKVVWITWLGNDSLLLACLFIYLLYTSVLWFFLSIYFIFISQSGTLT